MTVVRGCQPLSDNYVYFKINVSQKDSSVFTLLYSAATSNRVFRFTLKKEVTLFNLYLLIGTNFLRLFTHIYSLVSNTQTQEVLMDILEKENRFFVIRKTLFRIPIRLYLYMKPQS